MNERVALYARVSTATQENEKTIASQLEAIEHEAKAQGWTIAEERRYVDEGFSGARIDRPALDALRDAAADGLLDQIVIHSPDRLARNYVHQQVIVEELSKRGVRIHFVERPLGEKAEDRLLLQMQGVIAEYERAKIAERMRRGRLHRARAGEMPPFTMAPYGYRIVRSPAAPRGTVVVEEVEAEHVRSMFRWIAEEGLSVRKVARRLSAQGSKPRRAMRWTGARIYQIVTNPAYAGLALYNQREAVEPVRPQRPNAYRKEIKSSSRKRPMVQWIRVPIPAVIDEALQREVFAQLAKNKIISPRCVRHEYLLRTLVFCGECGCRMQCCRISNARRPQVYRYYSCPNRNVTKSGRRARPCPAAYLHTNELDALVWKTLTDWLQRPEMLVEEVAAWRDSREGSEQIAHDQARLESTCRRLQGQIDRLVDAYQYGALVLEELKARRERIEAELQATRARADELRAQRADSARLDKIGDELTAFAALLREGIDALDFAGRQRLVRLLVERVVVLGDRVTVEYAVPLSGRFCGMRPGSLRREDEQHRAEIALRCLVQREG
jgi:site-specific DNA recombinase